MKRIISFLAVILLLIQCLPVVAGGTPGEFRLSVGDGSGKQGETVEITVNIAENPGVLGFTVLICFDNNSLELKGITVDSGWSAGITLPQQKNGMYTNPASFTYMSGSDNTSAGAFLTLEFKIKNEAKLGNKTVQAVFETQAVNYAGQNVASPVAEGKISVTCAHAICYNVGEKTGTCTEPGYTAGVYCNGCGLYIEGHAEIPAAHRTSLHYPRVEPTCVQGGYIEYWRCESCYKYFSDSDGSVMISYDDTRLPGLGHTLSRVEAKAPTIDDEGNIEYWKCNDCETVYADKDGIKAITPASTVIEALIHVKDWIDESSGLTVNENKGFLSGAGLQKSKSDILEGFTDASHIVITDKDGNELDNNDIVGTGCKAYVVNKDGAHEEITIIIGGDVTGDGDLSSEDCLSLKSHLLGNSNLDGSYREAASEMGGGNAGILAYIRMKGKLLGLY